jgi:SAM-dependent methyltransferase
MRRPSGTSLIAAALAVKRFLAIRTRFNRLRFVLWKRRYGIRPLHNFLVDRAWGGPCGGIKHSPFAHLGAYATQSMDYAQLSYLFSRNDLPIRESDVLVDVGCGKGRVLNYWLGRGVRNRMIGIELDEAVAAATRRRLARFANVEIIQGDATEVLPEDGTLFFLFNPFGPDVLKRFGERLKHRRGIRIIYWYSLHAEIFRDDPWWSVRPLRTGEPKPGVLIRPRVDVLRDGTAAPPASPSPAGRLSGGCNPPTSGLGGRNDRWV